MIHERRTGGSGRGLNKVISGYSLIGTEENHKNPPVTIAGDEAEIQTEYLPNTNLECYLQCATVYPTLVLR
jgi:hypothetical protein